jgi:hypothetical protein
LASFIGNIPTISEKVIWCFDTRNPEVPIFTGLVVPKDEKKCVGQWDMGHFPSDRRQLACMSGRFGHEHRPAKVVRKEAGRLPAFRR